MKASSRFSHGYFAFVMAAAACALPATAGAQDASGNTGKSRPVPEASGHIGGSIERAKYSWADDTVTTSSTTYVNIPSMARTTKTKRKGPLIVIFCAEAHADEGEAVWVRVLLNGSDMLPDSSGQNVVFEGDNGFWYQSKCFTWAKKVPAGTHTIQARYLSANGGPVGLDQRSMTILQR
ncbi:hypothetical protein [Microbaculum marinum]|uniref:Uncharacterized protein n=1 Tax=Microbaculum marinum TaxID=1764581 RepID=A0AAW9RXC4_9HYPH